jgi:alpha-1,3-glucosyltransferase
VSRSRSRSHDRPALVDAIIPFYHSIDFEVHRHWLALTHSFPLSQWYSDETSPWTLDYPPFFAYFERVLSIFANPTMVLFQRITMILFDLCLLYGVYRLTKDLDSRRRISIWVLIIWSPMLVIVDHMHFQYNGFLLGLLLMAVAAPVCFVRG